MQGWTATTRHGTARTKGIKKIKEICLERTYSWKKSVNSTLKAIYIIAQRKALANQSWHKLFHFYLSFWIWKIWKGREKLNTSRTKRPTLMKQKAFFIVFEGLSFGEKIKNSGYKLYKKFWCFHCWLWTSKWQLG